MKLQCVKFLGRTLVLAVLPTLGIGWHKMDEGLDCIWDC